MVEHHTTDYTPPTVDVDYGKLRRVALICAVAGLAAWLILGAINYASYGEHHGGVRDFFLTYQAAFVFWVSIPTGAMTLLFLAFLTSASWGLVLRRVFQASTRTWGTIALLFIPIAVSLFLKEESPFWWVVPAAEIESLRGKPTAIEEQQIRQELYLNIPRFLVTAAAILGLYAVMSRALNNWSVKSEDEGDHESWLKLRALAGPGVVLWALTWTVAVTDWAMSVEPAWASTMFPVITAMSSFLSAITFATCVTYTLLMRNEVGLSVVKDKFRLDIGSLTLAFAMIWAYATYGQYMLIWAGNMPEEIGYPLKRQNGGWEYMAYLLILCHWLLPFIILLFRDVKLDPRKMRRMTVLLLFICAVDVTWWIVPAYPHPDQWLHVPMTAAAMVGVGGVWGLAFLRELSKRNLFPKKDTEFLATWGEHH